MLSGSMENIIEVKNLVKRYKKAKENAVDGISFSVREGEFFSFLGPNGAGKTTTISILTTTLSKTSGEVSIAGNDVEKQASRVRKNIGVIFQNPSLDENLTAEENIRFHAVLYGLYSYRPTFKMMPVAYQQRVLELAEVVGIQNDLGKPIKTFSGGMRRKLEIVRSLIHNPRVLFLDEPTAGLDPATRHTLWQYLRGVQRKENTTIFLTTHYLEEAEGADRVYIINHGKIVSSGTPQNIKEELVEEYVTLDAPDRTALKAELSALAVAFSEPSAQEPLKVQLKKAANIQRVIKQLETPLSHFDIHRPTLEEAYLEILDKNHAERT